MRGTVTMVESASMHLHVSAFSNFSLLIVYSAMIAQFAPESKRHFFTFVLFTWPSKIVKFVV